MYTSAVKGIRFKILPKTFLQQERDEKGGVVNFTAEKMYNVDTRSLYPRAYTFHHVKQ